MPVVQTLTIEWDNSIVRNRIARSSNPLHKVFLARQAAGLADNAETVMTVEVMDDGEQRVKFHTSLNNQRDGVVARRRHVAPNDTVTDPDA